MINPNLPVRFIKNSGEDLSITIIGVNPKPGIKYPIIGILNPRSQENSNFFYWNYLGECVTRNPGHKIENTPGFKQISVHTNVYKDGTTGFGYPSRELAEMYAEEDSHVPSYGIKQISIIVQEPEGQ